MSALLAIEGVTVRFGGVVAVDRVSLALGDGELLGFIGPNGAGKTTLLRAIIGLVTPQEGTISLAGMPLDRLPVHRRIRAGLALAQQIVKPFRTMTLAENVALALGAHKTRSPWTAMTHSGNAHELEAARGLLARVGLGDVAGRMPAELPLGFLKRLELARALALDPKLLLLDEPLAGLNQAEASAMADTIAGINRGGQPIVLIEHNLREVTRICPRLYVQDNGRKLADGPTGTVMKDRRVLDAYLGSHADADA